MFANRRAVLHIDDDPLITRLVAERLREAGFESEALNDPLKAIDTLIHGQYRIVVLDIHMPHRSGLQILTEIKRIDAGVQVIMLTGLVNETTVIEAMTRGAEACFFKPLRDPGEFLTAIDDAWRRNDRWWHSLRDLTHRRKEAEQAVAVATAD
ncbi:MAG: response regulator [Planctomycetota bacterium]